MPAYGVGVVLSRILDEHREFLIDQPRLSAFRRAIDEVVKPDDVVVDLGSGTGILGLMACRAGAARVYALDESGLTQLEREIFASNGFADRAICVKGLSTWISLPELADVVICDLIGRFGFDGGIVEYSADARRRLLKPGGTMIPSRIDLCVAPVEAPKIWDEVDFWRRSAEGFNLERAYLIAVNTGHPTKFQPQQILSEPAVIATIDLTRDFGTALSGKVTSIIRRGATLHGIGAWFTAELSPSVRMTNSPLSEDTINRRGVFFPLDPPTRVEADERVQIGMTIVPNENLMSWTVKILNNGSSPRAQFAHSTFRGMLLCPEDLRKAKPDFVPRLTSRGEARRSVVNLCDGRRSLAAIEKEVYKRHPNLFASLAEAAAFVAEVMIPYAYED